MTESLLLACVIVAVGAGGITWALGSALQPSRSRALANLTRGLSTPGEVTSTETSSGLETIAMRATLPALVSLLARQHARAGRPKAWPIGRLLVLKLLWAPVALTLLVVFAWAKASPVLLLLWLAVAVLIYFLPDLLLISRGQDRDGAIQRELADTLDQMTIAVEAGLGFDAALIRVASTGKGALAEELTRTLQDMRMGLSRRQAFHDLGERNHVEDLRYFIRAVIQADAFGISIGDVLRTQAAEMRVKRRQRAEAQAQKVPVKVLFPLMLCILPVLFIIIMTPAVMSLVEAFSAVG